MWDRMDDLDQTNAEDEIKREIGELEAQCRAKGIALPVPYDVPAFIPKRHYEMRLLAQKEALERALRK